MARHCRPSRMHGSIQASASCELTTASAGASFFSLSANLSDFLRHYRRFNTLLWWYACSCLSIGLILVIVAIRYIRAITLQMQSCAPSSMTVWRSVDFARTRRSLVFVTTAFIFVLGIIVAVIFAEASLGRHLYEEQIASLVGQSLALCVSAILSAPTVLH